MTIGKILKCDHKLLLNVIICIQFVFTKTNAASCLFRNGLLGECVQLKGCESALSSMQQGLNPEYCDFERQTVCCLDYPRQKDSPLLNFGVREFEGEGTNFEQTVTRNNLRNEELEIYEITPHNQYLGPEVQTEEKKVSFNDRDLDRYYSSDNGHFVPPGLLKKKPWSSEKQPNSDFYYEYVTKKPNRGQGHKGPNKQNGNNSHNNNNHNNYNNNNNNNNNNYNNNNNPSKWEFSRPTTKRPEWSGHGNQEVNYSGEWFNNQNQHNFNNQWSTTKRNKWNQKTTTVRYENSDDSKEGNSKPNRWPQRTSTEPNHHTSFPPKKGSRPQDNWPTSRPESQKKLKKSELKCQEYSKEVTENIAGLPLTIDPDPVVISVRKCAQAQQLIVGGENTTIGEFPHMAAIGFKDRNNKGIAWNCGGTLISEQFILTAAHCTSTSSGRPVKVRLGEYNLLKNDDGAHPADYAVSDIITHPQYKPPSKYHDIALLKLSRRVQFLKHIRPACLYVDDTYSFTKAIATGWGRMYYDGKSSEVLQKVELSIVDKNTCNKLYNFNVKTEVLSRGIVDSQLCAGELSGGKDTCQGDSGGPLSITNTKCIHHVLGITSFGKSCALPNSTGVYTKVSAYIPWIESIVWPDE